MLRLLLALLLLSTPTMLTAGIDGPDDKKPGTKKTTSQKPLKTRTRARYQPRLETLHGFAPRKAFSSTLPSFDLLPTHDEGVESTIATTTSSLNCAGASLPTIQEQEDNNDDDSVLSNSSDDDTYPQYEYGTTTSFALGEKHDETKLDATFQDEILDQDNTNDEHKSILRGKDIPAPKTHHEKLRSLGLSDIDILKIITACTICAQQDCFDTDDDYKKNIFSCQLVYDFLSHLKAEERTDVVIDKILRLNPYVKLARAYDVLSNFIRLLPEHRYAVIMGTFSIEDFAEDMWSKYEKRLKGSKYQDASQEKVERLKSQVTARVNGCKLVYYKFNPQEKTQ